MNKTIKLQIIILLIIIFFLGIILILYPRKPFNTKSKFQFQYFSNISKPNMKQVIIEIPILNQIHRNSKILNDLKTYIIFDKRISSKINSINIKVNEKIVNKKDMSKINCNLYPNTCLVKIPNNYINNPKVKLEFDQDLFKLSSNNKSFIGLYFEVSD